MKEEVHIFTIFKKKVHKTLEGENLDHPSQQMVITQFNERTEFISKILFKTTSYHFVLILIS